MISGQNSLVVGLNAVIMAVTDKRPRILTVHPLNPADGAIEDLHSLPFGPLDPEGDRTLELGLRRWVEEQTGIDLGYVEQLYTFGDRDREPVGPGASRRVLSVGYLALVREGALAGEARWRDCYAFLPWEDWRSGRPGLIDRTIRPALHQWIDDSRDANERDSRQDRVAIAFGWDGAPWDGERVLDRYELLYEAGLVFESWFDRMARSGVPEVEIEGGGTVGRHVPGLAMRLDHRRILATGGRPAGRICGVEVARSVFSRLDAAIEYRARVRDGDDVEVDQALALVRGRARAILAAERTALNFIGHLSGISTTTHALVTRIADYPAELVCTRKTTPGLRALEKYAVRVGGASNHRLGLHDAVLIKDNHLAAVGGIAEAVRMARTARVARL